MLEHNLAYTRKIHFKANPLGIQYLKDTKIEGKYI